LHGDAVEACADLVNRTGSSGFELGYVHDGVPVDQAGWYAHATYQGARIMVDEHRSPSAAALALAERILRGGRCRCGRPVTLADDQPGCRWRLMGKQWQSSCDAPPVRVQAKRGDLGAAQAAINRRARRAAERQARRR
jgi:hypothetical protein